jgi:hypothetical protein
MRRYVPLLIAGSALSAAACRDSVAPTRSEAPTTIASLGGGPNSIAALVGRSEDANSQDVRFTIRADGNTVKVGEFTLVFDANAVCNPETSGYGPAYWQQPCTPLGKDFVINARVFTAAGQSFVEFHPDIRFNPAVDVEISTVRRDIVGEPLSLQLIMKYGIWYTTKVGDTRFYVDEAFYDPTVATHFDTTTGKVWRSMRHFSGVVIRTGYCAEFPAAPECAAPPAGM